MFSSVVPFVRYAAKSTYYIDKEVVSRDCRIIYVVTGEGSFRTPETTYELQPGTIIYYPAGTPYHIFSESGILFYTVNFDFTHDYARTIPTVISPEEYDGSAPPELLDSGIPDVFRKTIFIRQAHFAEPLLREIYGESVRTGLCTEEARSANMKLLLIAVFRNVNREHGKHSISERIKELVAEDLHLNNIKIASLLSYHPFYINEVFGHEEGISLHKYIMQERLVKACELITTTDFSFEEIAQICGFSSASHLSRTVHSEYGITPSKMRKV